MASLASLERQLRRVAREMYLRAGTGLQVEELYQDDDEASAGAFWAAKYARPAWDAEWGPEPETGDVLVVVKKLAPRVEPAEWQDAEAWQAQLVRQAARVEAARLEEERAAAAKVAAAAREELGRLEVLKAVVQAKELEQAGAVAKFYPQNDEEEARARMSEAVYAAPAVASEVAQPLKTAPARFMGEGPPVLKLGPDGRRGSGSDGGVVLGPLGKDG